MSCDFEINILHRWRGIGGPRDGVMLLFLRHRAAKGSRYHIVGSSNSFLFPKPAGAMHQSRERKILGHHVK